MATLSANGRKLEMSYYTLYTVKDLCNPRTGDWFQLCLVNKSVPTILSAAFGFCRLMRRQSLTALLGSEMEFVQITKQIRGDRASTKDADQLTVYA
jgi:hypothetical protein